MKIATISSKNQITLPASLLASLGIGPKTKVLISKKSDEITIKPIATSLTDELGGSLSKYANPSKLGVPFEEVRQRTQELVAKELATKS
jgi:AbrB family looped-hinge helix DNA binding protein